jgi:hypothetical protein
MNMRYSSKAIILLHGNEICVPILKTIMCIEFLLFEIGVNNQSTEILYVKYR